MKRYIFGVDIGGTTVKLGLFDEGGCLLEKWEIPTNTAEEGTAILPDVAKSIRGRMADRGITEEDILGIGIGAPGAVDEDGFLVGGAVNLGWKPFDIPTALSAYINVPIKAANDAKARRKPPHWHHLPLLSVH